MAGSVTITYKDAAGKPTGISVNTPTPSGANFDLILADVSSLMSALNALSLSAENSMTFSFISKGGTPEDRGGVRGTKALIRWFSANEGDGGQYGSNEIGAVDPALFTVVGNRMLLQGTDYNSLRAAFNALAVTENGNAVDVYEVELVSRGL